MAGLDRRRASDFIGMLQQIGNKQENVAPVTSDPVELCSETIKTCQMASDALLLRERDLPLSAQPYSACCDTLVAKRKDIELCIEKLAVALQNRVPEGICLQLALLAEAVCVVTETAAQAVFMVSEKTPGCTKAKPSVLDSYVLHRGRLAIDIASAGFGRETTGPQQIMTISAVIATHLELIRNQLLAAAAKLKEQGSVKHSIVSSIANTLSGNATVLVSVIKAFVATPTNDLRENAAIFAKPVIATIDAIIEFAASDASFTGSPPQIKREVADFTKPLQAAAMSLVSAATLLVSAARTMLTHPGDTSANQQFTKYSSALNSALQALVTAAKATRDAKIMYEDP
eukprot:m.40463 g.40463  ORF g.40463 m.40463 type:complete len:344 (+) comp14820_c0_seq2:118-1149(+)